MMRSIAAKSVAKSAAAKAKASPAKTSPVKALSATKAAVGGVKAAAGIVSAKAAASKAAAGKVAAAKVADAKVVSAKAAAIVAAATARAATARNASAKVTNVKAADAKTVNVKTAASTPESKTVVRSAAPKVTESKASESRPAESKANETKAVAAKTATPVKPAAKAVAVAPKVEEVKKVTTQRQGFKTNEFVVYPAHGVGQILAIEEQEIAGAKLELFVINFIKDKMTLRVPTSKIVNVGMRKLSEPALVKKALETLKGRARIKRTMWSRRAQEYEAKINSGDIVAIAEVVRDLYRSESQPEQSYSERQLYEAALDRLSREIAVVQHVTETEAIKEIEAALAKSPRRGPRTEADAGSDAEDSDGDDSVAEDEAA
jgi:CarD family transcriptional regulator